MASETVYNTATIGGSEPPSETVYNTATIGGSEPPSEDEGLLNDIQEKIQFLQSMNPVMDSIYNGISIICGVMMEFKNYMEERAETSQSGGSGSGGGGGANQETAWVDNVMTTDGTPAFTREEAEQVHAFMVQNGGRLLEVFGLVEPVEPEQSGGGGRESAQSALESLSKFIDPRKVSLDGAVEFVLEYMDMMNDKSEDLAKQIGIIKLQNTFHGIPLEPIGIPYEVPTRLLFILLQGVLEVMRLISLFGFPGAGIFRIVGSFLGGLIELFKGDWKSALFTFMGIAGTGMLSMGLFAKIIVKVMSFMSNNSRDELIYSAYRGSKSLLIGFILFLISTFASFDIKMLIENNLESLGKMLGQIQVQIDNATKLAASEVGPCFTVEGLKLWPPEERADIQALPKSTEPAPRYSSKGLDFDHLIRIQDLFNIPAFFCNATIREFIEKMKFVPPARIVLELIGIPTTDRAHKTVCINLPDAVNDGDLVTAIIHTLRPTIRPKVDPKSGLPTAECSGSEIYTKAADAQDKLSGKFPVGVQGPHTKGIAASISSIESLGSKYKPEGMQVALFGSKFDPSKVPGLSKQKQEQTRALIGSVKGLIGRTQSLGKHALSTSAKAQKVFLPTTASRLAERSTSPLKGTFAQLPSGK